MKRLEKVKNVDDHQDDFINELKSFVFENLNELNFNQGIIADEFHISKSSIYRRIKSQTGLTPNSFIKEMRLQKAKEILAEKPNILLKQLAPEVGYAHQTYFVKIYSERFGIKPVKRINRLKS